MHRYKESDRILYLYSLTSQGLDLSRVGAGAMYGPALPQKGQGNSRGDVTHAEDEQRLTGSSLGGFRVGRR